MHHVRVMNWKLSSNNTPALAFVSRLHMFRLDVHVFAQNLPILRKHLDDFGHFPFIRAGDDDDPGGQYAPLWKIWSLLRPNLFSSGPDGDGRWEMLGMFVVCIGRAYEISLQTEIVRMMDVRPPPRHRVPPAHRSRRGSLRSACCRRPPPPTFRYRSRS